MLFQNVSPEADETRASRLRTARRRLVVMVVVTVAALGQQPIFSNDQVSVPLEDMKWRRHVARALSALTSPRRERGLELLQEAIEGGASSLFEVRHESLLTAPLATAVEAAPVAPKAVTPTRASRVRSRPQTRWSPRRFLPASVVAEQIVEHLPEDLKSAYRERYDATAAALFEEFERSGDVGRLEEVARRFFHTSDGRRAAELLGDVCWENSKRLVALRWWRRVVNGGGDTVRVRAKLWMAYRSLGWRVLERGEMAAIGPAGHLPITTADAHPILKKLPYHLEVGKRLTQRQMAGDDPETLFRWAVVSGFRPADIDSPSRWGGELGASGPPHLASTVLSLSWKNSLWSSPGAARVSSRGPPLGQAVLPLLDDDRLFIACPWALHHLDARADCGRLVERFARPGLRDRFGHSSSTTYLHNVTLWRRSREQCELLADLPNEVLVGTFLSDAVSQAKYSGYTINEPLPIRGLVAFDAAQPDRVLWATKKESARVPSPRRPRRDARTLRQLRGAGASAGEKAFSYHSPVVVKEGLVVAGGWMQRGFLSSRLRAHDLRDGNLVWERRLASFQVEQTMFGELGREPLPGAILEHEGVVFYATQLGLVCAIELATGNPLWATTYETIPIPNTLRKDPEHRSIHWGANSLLLVDDLLIVTPRDSQVLYAIDTGLGPGGRAQAGTVRWIYRSHARSRQYKHLLGYHDDYLYFAIEHVGVARLNVRDAAENQRGTLETAPPELGVRKIAGPGALTDQGLLVVDDGFLKLISFDFGDVKNLTSRREDLRERPWRVQVSESLVLLTSHEDVLAYVSGVAESGS